MLRFLLDAHLPSALVAAVQNAQPTIEIATLSTWESGAYLDAADDLILMVAGEKQWVLVTYDVHTLPTLLRSWAAGGRSHHGVVFGSPRTLDPSDVGGLARALVALWQRYGGEDWTGWTLFLEPADQGMK